MKRYLVTGGAGFIGSHLTEKLITKGNEVIVVDNFSRGNVRNLESYLDTDYLDIYDMDINEDLNEIFQPQKIDAIFHLAAQIDVRRSMENPDEDYKVNVNGTLNLINMAIKYKVPKFIFSSSGGAIYGDTDDIPTPETYEPAPISNYGKNKLTAENLLKEKIKGDLTYLVLRYSNVYGPRQSPKGEAGVVAVFLNKMLNEQNPLIYGDGLQTRDYVYVGDVVEANIMALGPNWKNDTYNVSTRIQTNVNELFEKINAFFDNAFVRKEEKEKVGEQKISSLDCSKLRRKGWKPKNLLNQGLEKTYEWFRENYIYLEV